MYMIIIVKNYCGVAGESARKGANKKRENEIIGLKISK